MLEVKHLTIRSKENQPLVQDISFSLIPGQPLGLTGASGSGKTTIIKAVMGILPYGCVIEEGEILLDGCLPKSAGNTVGRYWDSSHKAQ